MARSAGRRSFKKSYGIVGDGQTEKIYFNRLKFHEDITNVQIKPELPLDSNYSGILEKADQLLDRGVEKVYAIIDLDKIIDENKQEDFKKEKSKRAKDLKQDRLVIILCNPCFEIWFYLHFDYTTANYRDCSSLASDLKTYLKNYEKSKKYLTRSGGDIYKNLKPKLSDAVPNSKKTLNTLAAHHGNRRAFCSVHKIIEDLNIC